MFITDIFKDVYELTDERWTHIIREHPEIEQYAVCSMQYKERIQEVLGQMRDHPVIFPAIDISIINTYTTRI